MEKTDELHPEPWAGFHEGEIHPQGGYKIDPVERDNPFPDGSPEAETFRSWAAEPRQPGTYMFEVPVKGGKLRLARFRYDGRGRGSDAAWQLHDRPDSWGQGDPRLQRLVEMAEQETVPA